MCQVTRDIERHPKSQRRLLEAHRDLLRTLANLRRILAAKEESDAVARRHA